MDKKETVISAIKTAKYKVTPADIAAKTGLSFFESNNYLNTIASETRGNLEVTESGEIAYKFYPGFEASYIVSKFHAIALNILKQAYKIGFFLLRISFGIILILSVIIVLIGIYILLNSRSSNDNRRESGFGDNFFSYMIIRDFIDYLFFWNYQSQGYGYNQNYNSGYNNQGQNQNFLFSCFSFLFGDGNPNTNFTQKKWQAIAQFIQSKNGVVTANELAPFTLSDPTDENKVLPVLAYFEGLPQVTESGNIIYTFPKMTVTNNYSVAIKHDNYILEDKWKFSNYDISGVIILACFNFFGTWFLWFKSFQNISLHLIQPILALLCIYGTLFILIPITRLIAINILNLKIEARNNTKLKYYDQLKDPQVAKKIAETEQAALKIKNLSNEKVIYTTQKDNLEQNIEN